MLQIFLIVLCFENDSANRGDSLDRNIDEENRSTKDFFILVSIIISAVTKIPQLLFFL